MKSNYNYAEIEKKWQDIWDEKQTFAAKNDYSLPKFYGLVEFPYPSGQGLHVGHPRSYTALDIVCRKSILPTLRITNGRSGYSYSFSKRDLLTRKKCP